MPSYHSKRFLPFARRDVFQIVADVEKYPDFLPWCQSLTVLSINEGTMEAEMHVAKGPVEEKFRSVVQFDPEQTIKIILAKGDRSSGFLSELTSTWTFEDALGQAGGTDVSFSIEVSLSNFILNTLLGGVFRDIAADMVTAFEHRAHGMLKSPVRSKG